MLERTFLHIRGLGRRTERALWESGVLTWEELSRAGCPRVRAECLAAEIASSQRARETGDAAYFASRLPAGELWRLYPDFSARAVFFDIETTGLSPRYHQITTIATFDGQNITTYVRGENLARFTEDIGRFALLVSYNGKTFDVPFCEAEFPGLRWPGAHLDLRYLLGALGYRGGLKACEREMGLPRAPGLEAVDGLLAVKLWYRHLEGDARALPTLLRYNVEDVVNLRWLVERACNLRLQQLPRPPRPLLLSPPPLVEMSFDRSIIRELL